MSHILEEYSKNLGCYIGKPVIQRHFFPMREKKYVTISGDASIPSKYYEHYDMVISLLKGAWKDPSIEFIQLEGSSKVIKGVDRTLDDLTFKQYAYVVSRSILHIGPDNILAHYASSIGIPHVTIFGNVFPEVSRGYWSKKHMVSNIAAPWEVKPCMSLEDPEGSINKIKPEKIAEESQKLLKLSHPLNFKTVRIGSAFKRQVVEVIPNRYVSLPIFKNNVLTLRTDLGGDTEALLAYCFNHQVSLVLDNAVIPLETLLRFIDNLKQIVIFIGKEMDTIPASYLETLRKKGVEIKLLVKDESILNDIRIKYFNFSVDFFNPNFEKPDNMPENACFFSNKVVVDGDSIFPSKAHWELKDKSLDKSRNVIDNALYWEDLEHFYIYERSQQS